ncbi:MAG: zinc-ribbon domain-containing protein [Planctomycetota bacterium]
MSFEDKTLVCIDCNQEFTHSAEDQAFYSERGFANEPKRCRDCRSKRKFQGRNRGGSGSGQRESYDVQCAECGSLYCRDCFRSKRR